MSLIGKIIGSGVGAFTGFLKGGIPGAVVGGGLALASRGGDDINIASQLSRQVGCTIAQSDAVQARAMLQRGVNPCTGQNINPVVPGITDPRFNIPTSKPGGAPIPVFDSVSPGGGGAMTVSGAGLEFTSTGLIRNVIVNGRRISRRNAAAFIRKAGMEVGARGLGLSIQQAASVVLQQSTRPRRRRGVSGAQITQARRVINTLTSMSKALGCGTRRAPVRRKTSCR